LLTTGTTLVEHACKSSAAMLSHPPVIRHVICIGLSMPATATFQEAQLASAPIRNLGLKIAGTRLEPIVKEFEGELEKAGIRKLRPQFYLSTEWGVPFDTVSIAMPFYLAQPELTALHAERVGHVEGFNRADILRYLRHEMGHVVNYAYRLYEQEEWVKLFGTITRPYVEEYRPQPFSRRYVRHLPGWYAQKHPDEDWAETFAVWMTPGSTWQAEYADWPTALAKLDYCQRTMKGLSGRDPVETATEQDEDVGELRVSLEQYYGSLGGATEELLPGLDGALRAIFEDGEENRENAAPASRQPASALVRRIERDLLANVYRWTGHFPERMRPLLKQMARRADHLQLTYSAERELPLTIALTTFVTALAMNHVYHGSYLPREERSDQTLSLQP
jgi:hypothetical protein